MSAAANYYLKQVVIVEEQQLDWLHQLSQLCLQLLNYLKQAVIVEGQQLDWLHQLSQLCLQLLFFLPPGLLLHFLLFLQYRNATYTSGKNFYNSWSGKLLI